MHVPAAYHLLLFAPHRVARRLHALKAAGVIEQEPTLWQVWLGVLYMWARVLRRPETIGLSDGAPCRSTPRARRLAGRGWRFPALLWVRAVNPLDQTGLGSSTEHVIRHLVGAYHPGQNFLYDLQILDVEPGALEALEARVRAVVDGSDPHAAFLRDLVVYEGYHERLLEAVVQWRARGRLGEEVAHPDTTLPAFMRWCAAQPATPVQTARALAAGRLVLRP
jgi:hypothetical protein